MTYSLLSVITEINLLEVRKAYPSSETSVPRRALMRSGWNGMRTGSFFFV